MKERLPKVLTPTGVLIASAIWQAWHEMNAIRARDGIPYQSMAGGGLGRSDVQPEYWSQCVDDLAAAYKEVTGIDIKPWHPKHEFKASTTLV